MSNDLLRDKINNIEKKHKDRINIYIPNNNSSNLNEIFFLLCIRCINLLLLMMIAQKFN